MELPMPKPLSLAFAFAVTLALLVPAARAGTQSDRPSSTLSAAKKKHPRGHRAVRHGGQIACTVAGCQRIPPNCHPETEYNWDGIPTGFDMIVCGPRRR
jgi:hypothetical protein